MNSSAERFFDTEFPALVATRLDQFSRLSGTIAFSSGKERWTIRLGYLDVPVAPIFERKADIKIWFRPGALEKFVAGERPEPGDVRMRGDAEVLKAFGRFMSGETNLGYEEA